MQLKLKCSVKGKWKGQGVCGINYWSEQVRVLLPRSELKRALGKAYFFKQVSKSDLSVPYI